MRFNAVKNFKRLMEQRELYIRTNTSNPSLRFDNICQ